MGRIPKINVACWLIVSPLSALEMPSVLTMCESRCGSRYKRGRLTFAFMCFCENTIVIMITVLESLYSSAKFGHFLTMTCSNKTTRQLCLDRKVSSIVIMHNKYYLYCFICR